MSQKIFDNVAVGRVQHSAFDLSHERKQTMNFARLTPCLLEEVVPGDHYSCRTETLVRMQPMIAPIMERIDIYIHYFFVPSRILWDDWENFVTGGDKGDQAPTPPTVDLNSNTRVGQGSLADYFGLPTVADGADPINVDLVVSAFPYRAYWQIWNDYYRDEQLQDKRDITAAGSGYFYPTERAWGKDYFTSAFPSPQKGPAVTVPVEGTGGVTYKDTTDVLRSDGGSPPTGANIEMDPILADTARAVGGAPAPLRFENIDEVTLDQVGLTIEELRRSSRLQEWLELANRGGSRLVEIIKNIFDVHTGDSRLQRAEYLGGGKTPITISEVLNTTGIVNGEGEPQATMAGHGIASGATNTFKYKVKEHGYIMGISSILPQSTYSQGVNPLWMRKTRFDLYWPQFANIGEQTILNQELYFNFDVATLNEATFGYQQRFAEFKQRANSVHGEFKTSLAFWTVARKFDSLPALNEEFIECVDSELQDIFAVIDASSDKFLVQMYHHLKARRPMPYFSRPEL